MEYLLTLALRLNANTKRFETGGWNKFFHKQLPKRARYLLAVLTDGSKESYIRGGRTLVAVAFIDTLLKDCSSTKLVFEIF